MRNLKFDIRSAQLFPATNREERYQSVSSSVGKKDAAGAWYEGSNFARIGVSAKTPVQVAVWKRTIPVREGDFVSLWQEFQTEGEVELALRIRLFRSSVKSDGRMVREWTFVLDKTREEPCATEPFGFDGELSISILASGDGAVKLGTLHVRFGLFSCQRLVTEDREELFYRFIPMQDQQARFLNIVFGDFSEDENPQGEMQMMQMGSPYLLFSDPRGMGGYAFCNLPGSSDYEESVCDIIENALEVLGLSKENTIFTGTSLGAYAALYFGIKFHARGILLEKPVLHPGKLAALERSQRPGEFPRSLDAVSMMAGGLSSEKLSALDERLWSAIQAEKLPRTEIAIAYMDHDDYDPDAFDALIHQTYETGCSVYGKCFVGRHSESLREEKLWMMQQHRRILTDGK